MRETQEAHETPWVHGTGGDGLIVTAAEKNAMRKVLLGCPGQRLVTHYPRAYRRQIRPGTTDKDPTDKIPSVKGNRGGTMTQDVQPQKDTVGMPVVPPDRTVSPAAAPSDRRPAAPERPVEPFERGIVSFVRRGGRLTPKLQKAWDEQGPRFLLDLPRDPRGRSLSVDPSLVIDRNYVARHWGNGHPLVVEVGTGQGENIAAATQAHPELNFLALEVFEQGIAHLLHRLGEAGTTNVRIGEANAPLLFANNFSDGLLEEVWVWFPDPWPKMRHHKRRIIQPVFAADVRRCLKKGGVLRVATDIDDYALHVHEVMDAAPGWENTGTKQVWLATEHVGKGDADQAAGMPHALFTESGRFDGRVLTSFEKKGLAKGHTIHDFTYRAV